MSNVTSPSLFTSSATMLRRKLSCDGNRHANSSVLVLWPRANRVREIAHRTSSRWCAAKIKHRQTLDNKIVVVRCESIWFHVFPWTKASSAHSIAYTVKCQWIIESQQQQQRQLMMRENKLDSLYARCECDVMAHCTTVAITFNFGMETETFRDARKFGSVARCNSSAANLFYD